MADDTKRPARTPDAQQQRSPEDAVPVQPDVTGSQTGTVGGGGADAHNPSPVRATGVDDPTVPEDNR